MTAPTVQENGPFGISGLADHYLAWMLRVVFKERLFVFQVFLGRLHLSGVVGRSRHESVFTRCGSVPNVREQFPGVFRAGSRIQLCRLPWSLVDAYFNGLDRSAIIQDNPEDPVRTPFARD